MRKRLLEFQVGGLMFLKGALLNCVMCFEKKGKLNSRYVGTIRDHTKDWKSGIQTGIRPKLDLVRNVFHVSIVKKYISDPSHVLS